MQHSQIILATNNIHKKEEFTHTLQKDILTPNMLGISNFDPIENAQTFEGNAMLKAEALLMQLKNENKLQQQNIILADDSGLCVKLLNNEPGIFSARYANIQANNTEHKNADDIDNRLALIQKLKSNNLWGSPAFFQCSIAYIIHTKDIIKQGTVNGKCYGIVAAKEIGTHGFGYDCMFYRDLESTDDFQKIDFTLQDNKEKMHVFNSLQHSLATLTLEQKEKISHRGQAISALLHTLQHI